MFLVHMLYQVKGIFLLLLLLFWLYRVTGEILSDPDPGSESAKS